MPGRVTTTPTAAAAPLLLHSRAHSPSPPPTVPPGPRVKADRHAHVVPIEDTPVLASSSGTLGHSPAHVQVSRPFQAQGFTLFPLPKLHNYL
ncbi:hypothetical protein E2C01_038534 [Portunus trituberculatus]|uniref:Uncharacterized protein n=1 Tax=Portunus trituberculatus TaxID=210409 RepID=A0A5B7FKD7_PORTR|nr:hypothetical protein [Portunus trituberculatus]